MVAALISAIVLGFLAGLWAFKLQNRWCPRCGESTLDLRRHRHTPS